MKFTHYLLRNVIPEWVKLYLNFKLLKTYLTISNKIKDMLILAKKTNSKADYKIIKQEVMRNADLMEKLEKDNKSFINDFTEEVEKVENFCFWKLSDLKQKLIKCNQQIKIMRIIKLDLETRTTKSLESKNKRLVFITENTTFKIDLIQLKKDKQQFDLNSDVLLETLYRFYVETVQFQSFVDVNTEAIRKILKKYKKQMIKGIRNQKNEKRNFGDLLKKIDFSTIKNKLKSTLFDVEQSMVLNFYALNPKECRHKLRKYQEDKKAKDNHVFAFGFFAGYILIFILILLFLRYQGYIDPMGDKVFNKVFPCFRGMILFLTYYWFIALDVYGWNYFKINYKIYLGFNHHFSTTSEIIKRVSVLSTIFLLVFILYIMQMENLSKFTEQIKLFNPQYLPIICWIIGAVYLFIPTQKMLNGQGRRWMYRTGYGALFGHFTKYESRYTFFTDQFVSMVTPFRDVDYTLCYYYNLIRYSNEPNDLECSYKFRVSALLPSLIPYSMKCIQYITRARDKGKFWGTDEMWNFFKTLLAVQVGYLSFLARQFPLARQVWIPVAICSSLWQYWWDLKKDWLFFEPNSRNKFLRNDLGFNSPQIYYIIAVLNLILRGTWALSISPDMYIYFGIKSELFILLVGFLEMLRRFMNNFLKIEKEHILNLNNLKTVQDYKFPFDQTEGKLQDEIEDDMGSQWSVSTLNRLSYLEELPQNPELPQAIGNNEISMRSITMDQMQGRESVQQTYITPIKGAQQVAFGRSELNEINSNRGSISRDFRLTDIVSKQQQLSKYKMMASMVDIPTVNMEIINMAKKQEKLQKKKTKQIQEDNYKYKTIVQSMLEHYNLVKKEE